MADTNELAAVADEPATRIARLFTDSDTYYMGAELGAAYDVDDCRGLSMVRNVLKAPFVALWQTGPRRRAGSF